MIAIELSVFAFSLLETLPVDLDGSHSLIMSVILVIFWGSKSIKNSTNPRSLKATSRKKNPSKKSVTKLQISPRNQTQFAK